MLAISVAVCFTLQATENKQEAWNRYYLQCAKNGELTMLLWCLYNGANPNTTDPKTGHSALHTAAWHQRETIITALLTTKIDPLLQDKRGATAFDQGKWAKLSPKILQRLKTAQDRAVLEKEAQKEMRAIPAEKEQQAVAGLKSMLDIHNWHGMVRKPRHGKKAHRKQKSNGIRKKQSKRRRTEKKPIGFYEQFFDSEK